MKNIHVARILAACLVLSLVFFSGCDEDEESGNVELLSFGPSGVQHGEQIRFIGSNLHKVTAVELFPGIEIPSSQFVSQSAGIIELTIPTAAERGRIVLKTPAGDVESKSILDFDAPPITITGLPEGAKPGTNVTITGDNLNWVEAVVFNREVGVPKAQFVSRSASEIVLTLPMEAQSGFITFLGGGTEPEEITSESIFDVTLPAVTSLSPTSIRHEASLTITGTDLDLVTSVAFVGEVEAFEFVSQTEDELVVTVPTGALTGKVTLKQASPVTVASGDDLTIELPAATALSPKPATPGEDVITITGEHLDLVERLTFSGKDDALINVEMAAFTSHSASQIQLTLPQLAIAGPVKYTTIHGYSGSLGVVVQIPVEGPVPLDYYIFDDQFRNGWSAWDGWQVTEDFASTEETFAGTTSIKAAYTGQYGAVQLGAPTGGVNFADYTTFSCRVYVPAGQNYIIQLNDESSESYLSLQAGWNLVEIPTSGMAGASGVTELRLKNNNAATPVVIYIDEVGLKY